MLKIIMTVGIPASLKSTWARAEVAKDPLNWLRVNNDEIRSMVNASVYGSDYEKGIITETRNFLIRQGLKQNKNIIIDNLNLNRRHFDTVCSIAEKSNRDVMVMEKMFYCELNDAIARDAKREGVAKVGEEVIKKWWKESGKEQFKHYKVKCEVFKKQESALDRMVQPIEQNKKLKKAVVFDNDGTISIIHKDRSPYNAETCDQDYPNEYVIECMKMYFNAGYKILFVSGREEKDRVPTERFYAKYFPEVAYELYMRPTGSNEKDVIVKERIYNDNIKGKYFLSAWYDDRHQIVKWAFENGIPIFRVGDPDSSF